MSEASRRDFAYSTGEWPGPQVGWWPTVARAQDPDSGLRARLVAGMPYQGAWTHGIIPITLFIGEEEPVTPEMFRGIDEDESQLPVEATLSTVANLLLSSASLTEDMRNILNKEMLPGLVRIYTEAARKEASEYSYHSEDDDVVYSTWVQQLPSFKNDATPAELWSACLEAMYISTSLHCPQALAAEKLSHPGRLIFLRCADDKMSMRYAQITQDGHTYTCHGSCPPLPSEFRSLFTQFMINLKEDEAVLSDEGEDWPGYVDNVLMPVLSGAIMRLCEHNPRAAQLLGVSMVHTAENDQ